jgi:hypothetical protein
MTFNPGLPQIFALQEGHEYFVFIFFAAIWTLFFSLTVVISFAPGDFKIIPYQSCRQYLETSALHYVMSHLPPRLPALRTSNIGRHQSYLKPQVG